MISKHSIEFFFRSKKIRIFIITKTHTAIIINQYQHRSKLNKENRKSLLYYRVCIYRYYYSSSNQLNQCFLKFSSELIVSLELTRQILFLNEKKNVKIDDKPCGFENQPKFFFLSSRYNVDYIQKQKTFLPLFNQIPLFSPFFSHSFIFDEFHLFCKKICVTGSHYDNNCSQFSSDTSCIHTYSL